MTGELPYLADPVEPNAGMKARILDAVFEEEQNNEPSEVKPAVREAKPAPAALPKRNFTSSKWTPLIAAGLLVSLLGNAYAFYELSDQPDEPEAPAVAFETVNLQPSEAFAGVGTAAIVRDENALNLLVEADQLAPLSSGEVYQIWLIKDGAPIPAGEFTADEENEGAAFFSLEEDTEGWDTIAITLEPQRGNELPQGEIVLRAAIDPEA